MERVPVVSRPAMLVWCRPCCRRSTGRWSRSLPSPIGFLNVPITTSDCILCRCPKPLLVHPRHADTSRLRSWTGSGIVSFRGLSSPFVLRTSSSAADTARRAALPCRGRLVCRSRLAEGMAEHLRRQAGRVGVGRFCERRATITPAAAITTPPRPGITQRSSTTPSLPDSRGNPLRTPRHFSALGRAATTGGTGHGHFPDSRRRTLHEDVLDTWCPRTAAAPTTAGHRERHEVAGPSALTTRRAVLIDAGSLGAPRRSALRVPVAPAPPSQRRSPF